MEPNRLKRFPASALIVVLSFTATSCVYDDISPDFAVEGDYFPMTNGSRWKYVTQYHCNWPDKTKACLDTTEYFASGDPVPWEGEYQPLSAVWGTFRWVKETNGQYYAMGAYLPEYKFLDARVPEGGSWYHDMWSQRQQFSIVSLNTSRNIAGIDYHNIIEVLVINQWKTDTGKYQEVSREYHYYAKGVGEIYSFYPATPRTERGDIETSLIHYFIHP